MDIGMEETGKAGEMGGKGLKSRHIIAPVYRSFGN
jgi:hypothetical protein